MTRNVRLVHCSYHKCLTVYYAKVMRAVFNRFLFWTRGYHHFMSEIERFHQCSDVFEISSVNNHWLDLDQLGNCRVSRFIRDPRDLVVSGYFYHRRGAEYWCDIEGPAASDWAVVNGTIPPGMSRNVSFSKYLQSLSLEDGLIAEIDFREKHFASMLRWPDNDPRILTMRYEDIIGAERDTFRRLFAFYGFPRPHTHLALFLAQYYSAGRQKRRLSHIRNPKPSQWKDHFTPKVEDYFNQRYEGLLAKLGYSANHAAGEDRHPSDTPDVCQVRTPRNAA